MVKAPEVIFSENLREWMKQADLTQSALGDAMGVGQTTVTKWLKGSIPEKELWIPLMKYFGIESIGDLFSERSRARGVIVSSPINEKGRAVIAPGDANAGVLRDAQGSGVYGKQEAEAMDLVRQLAALEKSDPQFHKSVLYLITSHPTLQKKKKKEAKG